VGSPFVIIVYSQKMTKHKRIPKTRINKKVVIIGVILAAVMIGGTVAAVLPSIPRPASNQNQTHNQIIEPIITPVAQGVGALGSKTAKVTMVEFGDYQCEFCARFHNETIDDIIANFVDTGHIRYLFKDYVINDGPTDKASKLAAEASYCAADQGKYWEYHNELYSNSKGENSKWIAKESLEHFAVNIKIPNQGQFSDCLESHKHANTVNKNNDLANRIGLQATPTFVLVSNNTVPLAVQGAQPYQVFEQAITQVLTNASRMSQE
jgi:protein-disulfide isomerase